jgi:hypothetical protein
MYLIFYFMFIDVFHVKKCIKQECEWSCTQFQNSVHTALVPVFFCLDIPHKSLVSIYVIQTSVHASSSLLLCLFSAFVALFTLPKVYESNKAQIDQNLDVVRSRIADITSK